jgi:hypothetical protein
MTNKSKEFNDRLEQSAITAYIDHLKATTSRTYTEEAPIISIRQNQLDTGASMPDALITDDIGQKFWIEVTHFASSPEDFKVLCEMSKYPELYKGKPVFLGINSQGKSSIEILAEILDKKAKKDYRQFAQLSSAPKGVLIVKFVCLSPFFDQATYDNLLSPENKQLLLQSGIDIADFEEIVFTTYIFDGHSVRLIIETIVDATAMKQIKNQKQNSNSLK